LRGTTHKHKRVRTGHFRIRQSVHQFKGKQKKGILPWTFPPLPTRPHARSTPCQSNRQHSMPGAHAENRIPHPPGCEGANTNSKPRLEPPGGLCCSARRLPMRSPTSNAVASARAHGDESYRDKCQRRGSEWARETHLPEGVGAPGRRLAAAARERGLATTRPRIWRERRGAEEAREKQRLKATEQNG
jgi:hypothetical protein